MGDPKNFATQFLTKPTSSRSLTDPVPEEEIKEEADLPTPQLMIDSLYQILMKRLDEIEEKIDKLNG
jgi:hypothetical protein